MAMTLLVLELRVPSLPPGTTKIPEHALWQALAHLAPQILIYMMSFLTLGIFWVGQQTQMNYLERSHRSLAWIHMAFLFTITLMPFSTRLLAEFIEYRVALLAYWFNILLGGVALYLIWTCATKLGLTKSETPADVPRAIERRIVIAQTLYAAGALLCIFSTYWSIAFIVLVQLNYAIAPRLGQHD